MLAQIRPKNVGAIRTMLEAALTSGNTMGPLWRDLFQCVSQMEKLQLLTDDLVDLANAGAEGGRGYGALPPP
jgi:brefeldin A-inhibited guanine nucleotide-exchange protein